MSAKSTVESYYDENTHEEWERLGRHKTEFAVSLKVLENYLPPAPARVIDIGGGPGRYSIELAKRGYLVTLVDLSAKNLEFACEKASEAGVSFEDAVHGNALDLSPFGDVSFDAVLMMGPMYHLLIREEREQAGREGARILKSGGRMFTAFICRFAPFRWAARYDPQWYLGDLAYARQVLKTGVHDRGSGFTAAYFAHPTEIAPLMESCGLRSVALFGCEGAVSMNEDLVNTLEGDDWEAWVELNYEIGSDPSSLGAAEHILHVGEKLAH